MENLNFEVELTDTFGGEANYSWVRRKNLKLIGLPHSNRRILKLARKALGLEGIKLRQRYDLGDSMAYDLDGACIRLFLNFTQMQEEEA